LESRDVALITPNVVHLAPRCRRYVWNGVTPADTCEELHLAGNPIAVINMQASGTMGGASVGAHGSEDNVTYDTGGLRNLANTVVALTASGQRSEIVDRPTELRPVISGGSGYVITIVVTIQD
jgi:hypothetical protein